MERGNEETKLMRTLNVPHNDGPMVWMWGLLLVIPFLLASDLNNPPNPGPSLPSVDSYRSNLSDLLKENSEWRQPPQSGIGWRQPPPKLKWRSPSAGKTTTKFRGRAVEVFPHHRPGETSSFDYVNREDRSLMKVLEFDF